MAATFEYNEDNGAATGSPAKGTTRNTAVTQVNWKSVDDVATAYSAAPINAGENSFPKYQFGKFRIYGRNTLPEVFVPIDRYIPKKESDGIVGTAEVTSGNVYAGYGTSGDVEVGSIDASGDYNPNGISSGRIYSNNEHVILLWDDGSIWISEQNEEIMVEEYEEGGIMNMIPKKGTFKEGAVEHGDIQESI